MKSAVIVFPGSNCDRDVALALEASTGTPPQMVWHRETTLPAVDLIVLPGGFSYGDYLRAGAMSARSPIMDSVREHAARGVHLLGICNGFQVLTESGLLPGALMRNAGLHFLCHDVHLLVNGKVTNFTAGLNTGGTVRFPIAHHDGNYFADDETLGMLEDEGRVIFRYCDASGGATPEANPNGSRNNIAGITDETGRILGLMPHPERVADLLHGTDGRAFFDGLAGALS